MAIVIIKCVPTIPAALPDSVLSFDGSLYIYIYRILYTEQTMLDYVFLCRHRTHNNLHVLPHIFLVHRIARGRRAIPSQQYVLIY